MKRAFWQKVLPAIIGVFFAACPAYCSTYFVATNGNDTTGDGSIGNPWKTIPNAVNTAVAGDTIYVRGGTYTYTGSSTAITLPVKSGSSETNRCSLMGYNGERPLLDFSAMTGTGADGIKINGHYWYVKGLDCKGAPHNGIKINGGNYNIVEFCTAFENRNSGFQIDNGSSYNQIINCDSYYNRDIGDDDADGFAPKLEVGTDNYFYGCRSWQNSDDAYDGLLSSSDDVNTTYEKCWAFKAGYLKDGSVGAGNGNGFKMGGADKRHNATLINCLAFDNKAKGFDQNHNMGSMTLSNCTAYDNNSYSYHLPEELAAGKIATLTNCVSHGTGGVNLNGWVYRYSNSWQRPFIVTDDDFVSIDPDSAYGPRNPDGSLPDINFMHLAADSDLIDGGTDIGLPYHGSKPDVGYFEYGGCTTPNAADLDENCQVDLFDYAIFAGEWVAGILNMTDLADFVSEWLLCNRDPQSECWQ